MAPRPALPSVPTSIGSYIMPSKLPPRRAPGEPTLAQLLANKPTPTTLFNPKFHPGPLDPTYSVLGGGVSGTTPNTGQPGKVPATPGVSGTPAVPGVSAPSNDDLLAIATKIAAAGIDPQLAALKFQQQQDESRRIAQQYAGMGVMQALAQLGQGIPGAIQGAYQQAGQDISGYAQGLTGAVGQQAQSAAAQAADQLASLNAPGQVQSQSGAGMNTANYLGGYLPSSDLAAEAANRMAQASVVGYAAPAQVAYQTLQQMGATDQEIATLQNQGINIEATRPAAIESALVSLRQQRTQDQSLALQQQQFAWQQQQDVAKAKADAAAAKIQNQQWQAEQRLRMRAEGATETQIDNALYKSAQATALAQENQTGRLWTVVRTPHGYDAVPTSQAAPGSTAAKTAAGITTAKIRAQSAAQVATIRSNVQAAHNRAMEGIANAKLGISQQQADAASQRAQAYASYQAWKQKHPNATGVGPGGLKQSDIRQYGKEASQIAGLYFYGAKNPKWDASKGGGPGKKPVAGNPYYSTAPRSASDALGEMVAKEIPYQIAWNAIYQFAGRKNSQWADALQWNPKYKKGREAPGKTP